MFYCEIISGLWVSDIEIMNHKNFIIDKDITLILNCTQIIEFPEIEIEKIRLPFPPKDNNENIIILKKNYKKIIDLLHNQLDYHNILISCYDGISISILIVAIYLLHHSNIHKKSINEILLKKSSKFLLWCDLDLFIDKVE